MTNQLSGEVGQIGMTIEIKRAATGKTETYNLIGKVMTDGSDPLGSSASGCD